MSIYLGVLRPGKDISVVIKSVCNYLCRIYYTFKKESRCMIVIKNEKGIRGNKAEICAHNNVNKKSAQSNQ